MITLCDADGIVAISTYLIELIVRGGVHGTVPLLVVQSLLSAKVAEMVQMTKIKATSLGIALA